MRLSLILLVAAAVLASTTESKQTKISAVASVQSASVTNSRFLRTIQTDDNDEDDDDDDDLDSEDEERFGMPSFLTKLLGQGDDAAAAAKKLQPQQVAKLSKVDDVKPSYLNNPLLRPEGEALAAAKKLETQWMAQLSKTDKALLKKINTTPGAARRISQWRLAEWDPTKLAQLMKKSYPSVWKAGSSEKKAWDLYAAMFLRQHFAVKLTKVSMVHDKELRETVRAAFACYDEDSSGWIDAAELRHLVADLGGVLTERDFRKALRVLDCDGNGVIDKDEFTEWWQGQTGNNETTGEVEKTLARLKDLGRQRFRVDIHTACWNGCEDVVARLVEDGSELLNEKDASEYGNSNTPLHYAAYQGHEAICNILIKQGAGINNTNGSGCTPVVFAAQQGHVEIVKLLLQNGAELRIAESKHGLTPVDVCTTPAITELFRNLSGKPPSTPSAPTLDTLSDAALKITWSPPRPNLDEVVPVSGYKIKLSSPTAPSQSVLAVAFPTETSIGGLCPDSEYVAVICAINLHGVSEFSAESQPAKTRRAKPAAPVVCATEVGPTEITLMWALADNDRQPGTSCVIYLSSPELDGSCKWESIFGTDDISVNSTVVEKLLPDHRYKLRAAVIGEDGQQTLSDAIAVRTASKTNSKRSAPSKVVGAVNVLRVFGSSKKEAKASEEVNAENQ